MDYEERRPDHNNDHDTTSVSDSSREKESSLLKKVKHVGATVKDIAASTTAGWVAYTPIMAPIEYFWAGMDGGEVLKTRAMAGFGHLIGLPLYQKSREYFGRKFNVTEDSSKLKKRALNALAFVPVHPPTYALFLALSGASLEEMKYALPAGLAVVMVTSPIFTPFMEFWRTKVFKEKPTLKKKC